MKSEISQVRNFAWHRFQFNPSPVQCSSLMQWFPNFFVCGTLQSYFKWTRNPRQDCQVNTKAFFTQISGIKVFKPVLQLLIHREENGNSYQRWAESHFSDSDSTPASGFKTPALTPTPKNFLTSTPTPVYTPKTSK